MTDARGRRRRRATREPVTPERIVATAVRIMDTAGLEAVTMRRLAAELGVEATALYHHMPNKDAIMAGVAEVLEEEILPLQSGGTWQEQTRDGFLKVYDVLERHPEAAPIMARATRASAVGRARLHHLLANLRAAGFDVETTVVLYHTLAAYLIGFRFGASLSLATPPGPGVDWAEYPAIVDVSPRIAEWRRREFADGVDLIIRAFEPRRSDARQSS